MDRTSLSRRSVIICATRLPTPPIRSTVPGAPPLEQGYFTADRARALRHHHDAEALPGGIACTDGVADLLDIEGDLGDQDDIGGARDPAVQRDPARVPSHQFHHHDALVALGGGVQLVDRLGGGADGGIEAEGLLGALHVVVDRLGHADHGQSLPGQVPRDLHAAVAANGDERVESARAERRDQLVGAVGLPARPIGVGDDVAEWIALVGGAEDGAAEMHDAADVLGSEAHHAVEREQPFVTALDPVYLPAPVMGGEHDGPDDGIESGGVAAAGIDGDTHGCGSRLLGNSLEQVYDLARLGVPARGALREHQFPIDHHVENTAGTGDQLRLDAGKRLLQLSHQTGGSWFVVSNDAVVDRGAHGSSIWKAGAIKLGGQRES